MNLKYALITPVWNEEAHLNEVVRSVVSQTLLPVRWVIVNDGSTDRTDEIVGLLETSVTSMHGHYSGRKRWRWKQSQ